MGVQVHFKGGLTIKNLLMAPKDKDHILKESGVIYRYRCDRVECDEEYIGESARTFAERFKEYLKAPSPIYDHASRSGHDVNIDQPECTSYIPEWKNWLLSSMGVSQWGVGKGIWPEDWLFKKGDQSDPPGSALS